MITRCPGCGHPIEPDTRAVWDAAERDAKRRKRDRAYKRARYASDPAYRAASHARVAAYKLRQRMRGEAA